MWAVVWFALLAILATWRDEWMRTITVEEHSSVPGADLGVGLGSNFASVVGLRATDSPADKEKIAHQNAERLVTL